jgi:lactate permease
MHWTQNYDPFGSPVLSTLVAALPIVLLLGLLATGRVSAQLAALIGLMTAMIAAVLAFAPVETQEPGGLMEWTRVIGAAAVHGAAFGLFPIGWIVLAAIFLYALTVDTGQFEIVKHSVMALSDDRRIQALLIAFCFGAFVEGAAGFGTPVAISAALLMGAGFKPLHAAGLALLANTSPVAFGALGTPIKTLAEVTRPTDPPVALEDWTFRLSQMAGRQLPFFSLIVPGWLVWTMAGWRGVAGVWPALAVCGGSFAAVQYLVANHVGPELVDVAGGLFALVALALFLRVWQPKDRWQFPDEAKTETPPAAGEPGVAAAVVPETNPTTAPRTYSSRAIAYAWVPWVLLSVFVFLAGLKPVREAIDSVSLVTFTVGPVHEQISRAPPVVPAKHVEKAEYKFNWLSATGTAIFAAAIVSAFWLRIAPARFLRIFAQTCYRMRWPLFTIACMLALAYVTRYSGMDATLGLAFTHTGFLYPLFAALLGWLGVALTGSDTSSNALFGSLQKITAEGLVRNGVLTNLKPLEAVVLLATANSTGGVMGKMIDAQSIVVSAAATQQPGQEGAILRFVFWHSLILAILMGLFVMLQAYVWTAMIP